MGFIFIFQKNLILRKFWKNKNKPHSFGEYTDFMPEI